VAVTFAVVFHALPICMGAWMVLFNRRFSVDSLRYRERVWKIGFNEFDVKLGRIYAVSIGAGLLILGLILAADRVL
jgi:hypothetical protein